MGLWEFTSHLNEREIGIRQNILGRIPNQVLDCHTHTSLATHTTNISRGLLNKPATTFLDYSIARSQSISRMLWGDKRVSRVRMPMPLNGADIDGQNKYIASNLPPGDLLVTCGDPLDCGITSSALDHPLTHALKMYAAQIVPQARYIYEYFPKWVLDTAQAAGLPIVLHLPAPINKCLDQLGSLSSDFPRLRVIVAHLGLLRSADSDTESALVSVCGFENLFFDLSTVPNHEPIQLAMKILGPSRLLYGSDEPASLLRITTFQHPSLGTRFISSYRYDWINPEIYEHFSHLSSNETHLHWSNLQAIIEAADEVGLSENDLERIFYHNAREVFHTLGAPHRGAQILNDIIKPYERII